MVFINVINIIITIKTRNQHDLNNKICEKCPKIFILSMKFLHVKFIKILVIFIGLVLLYHYAYKKKA